MCVSACRCILLISAVLTFELCCGSRLFTVFFVCDSTFSHWVSSRSRNHVKSAGQVVRSEKCDGTDVEDVHENRDCGCATASGAITYSSQISTLCYNLGWAGNCLQLSFCRNLSMWPRCMFSPIASEARRLQNFIKLHPMTTRDQKAEVAGGGFNLLFQVLGPCRVISGVYQHRI